MQPETSPPDFSQMVNRLDPLLVLRGIACFMVVIHHSSPPRNSILHNDYDLSWLLFSPGYVAVWIFFSLSGYLMGKAFYTGRYSSDISDTLTFWRNRILRIFPLYYFAIFIQILFVYPDILRAENWIYLVRLVTFTYNNSLPIHFNGPLWTISTEVQFYFLVPFIYSVLKPFLKNRKQVLLTGMLLILSVFCLRYIFLLAFKEQIHAQAAYTFKYIYTPLLLNLDLFLCGFLVNPWIQCQKKLCYSQQRTNFSIKQLHSLKLNYQFVAIGLLVILYLISAHHGYTQELWGLPERTGKGFRTATIFFILPVATALVTSFFIYAVESSNADLENYEKLSIYNILRNPARVLEILGILSYGVYVWHRPILERISPIFTSTLPVEAFYMRLVAGLILSVLLAALTYFLVELPAAKWKITRKAKVELVQE